MRICSLLAWYDESPATLTRAVRSAADSGGTDLIAVDGAYSLIPDAKGKSPPGQRAAIEQAARVAGLRYTIFDSQVWETEMHKRDFMFRAADVFGENDWLLILDADFEVRGYLRRALAVQAEVEWHMTGATPRVFNTLLTTPDGPMLDLRYGVAPSMMFRCVYRGGQQITVTGNHYSYTAADGARLWGSALGLPPLELPVTLDGIEILHWTYFRDPDRVSRQVAYYVERDRYGIERGPCIECGVTATSFVPRVIADLGESVDTRFAETCDKCAPELLAQARRDYVKLGGEDPAQLRIVKPT